MAVKVTLNHAGIAAILKSGEMVAAVHAAAEQVAANVDRIMVEGIPGKVAIPVEVSDVITDRAHSNVTLAHPSGIAVEAKHGVLNRAAGGGGDLVLYTTKSGKTRTATRAQVANWTRGSAT